MKIDLFVDADDTILNSSVTVIEILNQKYKLSPKKTIDDLTDWSYRSIYGLISKEEVAEIYGSDLFFENVKVVDGFKNVLNKYDDKLNVSIVSFGDDDNLKRKEIYFKKELPKCKFVGLKRFPDDDNNFSKSKVNMKGGIQMDDRIDCLNTNAACKILVKDKGNFAWNYEIDSYIDNLYVLRNWLEIEKTIGFFVEHTEFLKSCNDQ